MDEPADINGEPRTSILISTLPICLPNPFLQGRSDGDKRWRFVGILRHHADPNNTRAPNTEYQIQGSLLNDGFRGARLRHSVLDRSTVCKLRLLNFEVRIYCCALRHRLCDYKPHFFLFEWVRISPPPGIGTWLLGAHLAL